MLAWATYHMFKYNNAKIVRYGAVFLMVAAYIFVLVWSLILFADNNPRNALLFLIVASLFVAGMIILSKFVQPDNNKVLLPLILGLVWLIYMLYFTWGIISENEDRTLDTEDKII